MSATEVIEQIKKLPRDERQKEAAFVRKMEADGRAESPTGIVSEDFKQRADEVFTTNAELFRKLAE
jgi:hypothetical protein